MDQKPARLSQDADKQDRASCMLERNGQGCLIQEHVIQKRHHQQHTSMCVTRSEPGRLKRRERVTPIEKLQQRIAAVHHSRQRDPTEDDPHPQCVHMTYPPSRFLRQAPLSHEALAIMRVAALRLCRRTARSECASRSRSLLRGPCTRPGGSRRAAPWFPHTV